MLLGAHAQHAHQAHCRQENGSPHRSPFKPEFAFSSNSDGSGRLATSGAPPSSSIRDTASSSDIRWVDEKDSEALFSLRQERVNSKALSSSASTSCNTPQSSTNKWPSDTSTFRSVRCIQTRPFSC